MSSVLVIGAGGVGSVAVHKMAMLAELFSDITLASRRQFKCDEIAASVKARTGIEIKTAEIDADDAAATAQLIKKLVQSWSLIWPCHIRICPLWMPALKLG